VSFRCPGKSAEQEDADEALKIMERLREALLVPLQKT